MNENQKQNDLEILRERQAYIDSAVQHLNDMRSHQQRWISFARASGATWAEVGEACSVSAQAAEQGHGRWLERERAAGRVPPAE